MTQGDTTTEPLLGFLTVVDEDQLGLVGGYLILNATARPVEFHCTAPLRPTRAQQILYGPTLAPYLYGEQIGQALVAKSGRTPLVLLTDQEAVLAARALVEVPLALVVSGDRQSEPHAGKILFEAAGHHLAVLAKQAPDRDEVARRLADLGHVFDLSEPFERIRLAIEEAQREAKSRAA
jgi:hypothetical protein